MRKIIFALLILAVMASAAAAAEKGARLVTFSTYESKFDGFEAKIVTPIILGLKDADAEKELNAALWEISSKLIENYERDVVTILRESPNQTVHMGVVSDYEITTDTDKILAFNVYVMNIAGSSSTTKRHFTIDKTTGRPLTLEGLFKQGADYVTPLSRYVLSEMKRRNDSEGAMFWIKKDDMSPFTKIAKDQKFYIDKNGALVICFDKYEVAPGAQGASEFVIPDKVIKNLRK